MCVMSAVTFEATHQWPQLDTITNLQLLIEIKDILKKLEALDKKFSTKDCVEPGKEEYISQLEARIAELEGQLSKVKEAVATTP